MGKLLLDEYRGYESNSFTNKGMPFAIKPRICSSFGITNDSSNSFLSEKKKEAKAEFLKVILEALDDNIYYNLASFVKSNAFIENFDYRYPPPSFGIEPDGCVLLEWYLIDKINGDSIFSTVFKENNYIYSSIINGVESGYGIECYSDDFCSNLLHMFDRFYKRSKGRL